MIEDLDGGDLSPSHIGVLRVMSVVLAFSALIGWAALSSPVLLRGPYATPDPAGGVSLAKLEQPRHTPMPFTVVEPAAVSGTVPSGCIMPGSEFATTIFLGGRSVTFTREIVMNPSSSCLWFWSLRVPADRFAR